MRRRRARARASGRTPPRRRPPPARQGPTHPLPQAHRGRGARAPRRASRRALVLVLQRARRGEGERHEDRRALGLRRRGGGRGGPLRSARPRLDPRHGPALGRRARRLLARPGEHERLAALRGRPQDGGGDGAAAGRLRPRSGRLLLSAGRQGRLHVRRRRTGPPVRVRALAHDEHVPPRSGDEGDHAPHVRPGLGLVPERAERRAHPVRAVGILRHLALFLAHCHDDAPGRHAPDGLLRLERLLAEPLRQPARDPGRQREVRLHRDGAPHAEVREDRAVRREPRAPRPPAACSSCRAGGRRRRTA